MLNFKEASHIHERVEKFRKNPHPHIQQHAPAHIDGGFEDSTEDLSGRILGKRSSQKNTLAS
jgi:hypothetical protein